MVEHTADTGMRLSGYIPDGVPNFFSILVYRVNEGREEYYELNYRFHGHPDYKSPDMYNLVWQNWTRKKLQAAAALERRTRDVLWRAGISPVEYRYMTTINLYDLKVKQNPFVQFLDTAKSALPWNRSRQVSSKESLPKVRVRSMRHVSGVVLEDGDFVNLYDAGMLRRLYEGPTGKHQKRDQLIFKLAPLQARSLVAA